MRTWLLLAATVCAFAGTAQASVLPWEGTVAVDVGNFPGGVSWTGTGMATVNGSGGGASLSTLAAGPLLLPPTMAPPFVAFTSFAVPTHPLVTPDFRLLVGLAGEVGLGTGTLTGFSGGGLLGGAMPVRGIVGRSGGVSNFSLTRNGGNTGFGVGGNVTTTRFICPGCPTPIPPFVRVRLSIEYAPWTLGTATVNNSAVATETLAPVRATRRGFMHGPASNTSSAAVPGGVLQIVTPMQVRVASGVSGNEGRVGYFGTLTLRFVPEPGRLVLLASGALCLALLGWRRRER